VRIIGARNRLVFGVYRRQKTICHLGQIDELFGAPATTRSWNTMLTVLRILNAQPTNAPIRGPLRNGKDDPLERRAALVLGQPQGFFWDL
jgi:hypothetical protein